MLLLGAAARCRERRACAAPPALPLRACLHGLRAARAGVRPPAGGPWRASLAPGSLAEAPYLRLASHKGPTARPAGRLLASPIFPAAARPFLLPALLTAPPRFSHCAALPTAPRHPPYCPACCSALAQASPGWRGRWWWMWWRVPRWPRCPSWRGCWPSGRGALPRWRRRWAGRWTQARPGTGGGVWGE